MLFGLSGKVIQSVWGGLGELRDVAMNIFVWLEVVHSKDLSQEKVSKTVLHLQQYEILYDSF